MNILEWILLALLSGPVCFCAYVLGMAVRRMMHARKINACTVCPSSEDAERDESRINAFFYGISSEAGIDLRANKELWQQAQKNHDFIRVCHALGYELVIRKVSDKDIEQLNETE